MTANMPATAVATFMRVTFRAVDGIVTRVVDRAAGKVDLLGERGKPWEVHAATASSAGEPSVVW